MVRRVVDLALSIPGLAMATIETACDWLCATVERGAEKLGPLVVVVVVGRTRQGTLKCAIIMEKMRVKDRPPNSNWQGPTLNSVVCRGQDSVRLAGGGKRGAGLEGRRAAVSRYKGLGTGGGVVGQRCGPRAERDGECKAQRRRCVGGACPPLSCVAHAARSPKHARPLDTRPRGFFHARRRQGREQGCLRCNCFHV
jgi:hypothetical protein